MMIHTDQILFMENGKIVRQDNHMELHALNGRYRALHYLQIRPEGAAT